MRFKLYSEFLFCLNVSRIWQEVYGNIAAYAIPATAYYYGRNSSYPCSIELLTVTLDQSCEYSTNSYHTWSWYPSICQPSYIIIAESGHPNVGRKLRLKVSVVRVSKSSQSICLTYVFVLYNYSNRPGLAAQASYHRTLLTEWVLELEGGMASIKVFHMPHRQVFKYLLVTIKLLVSNYSGESVIRTPWDRE